MLSTDARYISLCYSNEAPKNITPRAATYLNEDPEATCYTFKTVAHIRANETFQTQATLASGENIAVFGKFSYRSRTLGESDTSPFSVWRKVDKVKGQVTYMQFMKNTFGTVTVFGVDGQKK